VPVEKPSEPDESKALVPSDAELPQAQAKKGLIERARYRISPEGRRVNEIIQSLERMIKGMTPLAAAAEERHAQAYAKDTFSGTPIYEMGITSPSDFYLGNPEKIFDAKFILRLIVEGLQTQEAETIKKLGTQAIFLAATLNPGRAWDFFLKPHVLQTIMSPKEYKDFLFKMVNRHEAIATFVIKHLAELKAFPWHKDLGVTAAFSNGGQVMQSLFMYIDDVEFNADGTLTEVLKMCVAIAMRDKKKALLLKAAQEGEL